MNIESLFEKQLTRNINGVVKAEQLADDVIYTELDEYVVTNELDKHFRSFFETYVAALDDPASASGKVGVWISGFFGSGKSHFLKILSYLLANKTVSFEGRDKTAIEFFESKISDKFLYGDIHKTVQKPTEVILFNIDSRANSEDKDSAILKVFLKVFNDLAGYCADHPHVAHLERELDKKGQYQAFKDQFSSLSSSTWEEERDAFDFYRDEMIKALHAATGQTEDSCRQWIDALETNFPLSIQNFSKWVKEYLDQDPNKNLLFLVDEIGQFIGKNTNMMLQLQTIVETLGVETVGRAWVIVTAQADIDAAIGQLNKSQGDEFSRIQGRFATRLQLSSSNTAEVIQKRLLTKTSQAAEVLSSLYLQKQDVLRNQLSFDSSASIKNYSDVTSFVDTYPFVPYHFELVQKVFESIRIKGATGKHLAMGERSLLDAFQSAAKQIKDRECGVLVSFDRFYSPIESFLEPAVKRTIDMASEKEKLTEFDSKLLKTLFLIRYVDTIKSTVNNLVTLLVDEVDADKLALQKQIEASLIRLENEVIIARNGGEYNFLTNEEKEIENEIRHTDVESTSVNNKISEMVFDSILKGQRAYRYPVNKQEFKVSRFCNGHPKDGSQQEDLVLKIVTPNDVHYESYAQETFCNKASLDNNGCLLITLEDDKALWDDLLTYVKTERFLRQAPSMGDKDYLLREKAIENNERHKRLVQGIENLIAQASFYAIGSKLSNKVTALSSAIESGYRFIIENTFSKLKLLTPYAGEVTKEIQAVLTADDLAQIGLDLNAEDANPLALKELENYIGMKNDRSEAVFVKGVLEYFGKRPYGWPEAEVILLLAKTALAGKVSFSYQANPLKLKQAYEPLTNSRKRAEVRILKIRQHDESMLVKAAKIYKNSFNKTFTGQGEKKLAQSIMQALQTWQAHLKDFQSKSQVGQQFPGSTEIKTGLVLVANLIDQPNQFSQIESFVNHAEALEDFAEDFEDLQDFYTSQLSIWQKLQQALNQTFKLNRPALEKEPQALTALQALDAIYQNKAPYNQLNKVSGLIDQVQQVNSRLLEKKREHGLDRVNRRITNIEALLTEAHAPDEIRNTALYPLQQAKCHIEQAEAISSISEQQQYASEYEDNATEVVNQFVIQQAQKAIKPPPRANPTQPDHVVAEPPAPLYRTVTNFLPANYAQDTYLETEEDVEIYLQTLKTELLALVKAGHRVKIK